MSETIADIITEARGVFDELRKHGYNVVSVDRMEDIIDRVEEAHKREREAGAEAAQICGEIGEMVGREASKNQSVTNCNRLGNAARMREKKYELTNETKTLAGGTVLHRIRALRDIPRFGVKAGELGGFVEEENNLSQDGDAWVSGKARVSGGAEVSGNAKVFCNADYMVVKNIWSSGRWFTYTRSNKKWSVGCFYGTGEELIKKAYADSELSGKCYEAIVHAVETIEAAKAEAKGEANGSK